MTSLSAKLAALAAANTPIQVGLIGAGKFGSMFISQCHQTPGMRLAGIADLSTERAFASLERTGYPAEKYSKDLSLSIAEGIKAGKTVVTTDAEALIAAPGVDVVLECTGSPAAGVRHALLVRTKHASILPIKIAHRSQCCTHKTHIIMINVEADVLAGPLLARRASQAGILYSLAYGDQPALIAELVDWARTAGFNVVCAGKGTKHLPEYHYSTPDTVWQYYGFTDAQLATGDFNPQMFNSFLDGTKSALEMAAVSNACGLTPPADGLKFPPCSTSELPKVLAPATPAHSGQPPSSTGTVEVVSCLNVDGTPVLNDLRWGVYVVIAAPGPYQRDCFAQYGLQTDSSGWYAVQYKPFHLIGLELGVSVANVMCRSEPTGCTKGWNGDVVATAKRALKAGEKLDGEGGFMVFGKLTTARQSLELGGLPIGLAHGLALKKDIAKDHVLTWGDVDYSENSQAVSVRKEMEAVFRQEFGRATG